MQNSDGGFGQSAGRSSNAQSTAYAVQGLVAAGRDPGTFRKSGRSPLVYLRSLQRRNGRIDYSRISGQTPVWVTAQAVMALERKPLPLATVPRRRRRAAAAATAKPAAAAAAGAGAAGGARAPAKRPAHGGAESGAERSRGGGRGRRPESIPTSPAGPARAEGPAAGARPEPSDPSWVGAALSLALAALAAWGGWAWRRRHEHPFQRTLRISAKTVSSQEKSLPET
jgi:hypothetical protein